MKPDHLLKENKVSEIALAAAIKTATPKGKKLCPNKNKHVCNLKRTQSDFTTLLLCLKIAL